MALKDDKARIMARLDGITDVTDVLPVWPKVFTEKPIIVVSEASNKPADTRDNREYATELQYYVRVFASKAELLSRIASDVDDRMTDLGYMRMTCWEDDGKEVRQKVMIYSIDV